jgi:hypothetical protein
VEFIDPEHDEVDIIEVEDRLLVLRTHLEVVLTLFLVPGRFRYEGCFKDVTQLEDVVGGDRELVRVLVRDKDSFNWIYIDIALVAV